MTTAQNTVEITLLLMSGRNLPTGVNGYLYAHRWKKVHHRLSSVRRRGRSYCILGADGDGEFELADTLTSEVELMVNALNAKRSLSKRIVEEVHVQRQTDAGAIASSQTRRQPNRVVGSASVAQHHGDQDAVAVEVAAEATHTQHISA